MAMRTSGALALAAEAAQDAAYEHAAELRPDLRGDRARHLLDHHLGRGHARAAPLRGTRGTAEHAAHDLAPQAAAAARRLGRTLRRWCSLGCIAFRHTPVQDLVGRFRIDRLIVFAAD